MTLLMGMYYLYRRSSKLKKALRVMYSALQIRGRIPTRVVGTHWIPHLCLAIDLLVESCAGIITRLEDASHDYPNAGGLVKTALNISIMAFIHFFRVSLKYIVL